MITTQVSLAWCMHELTNEMFLKVIHSLLPTIIHRSYFHRSHLHRSMLRNNVQTPATITQQFEKQNNNDLPILHFAHGETKRGQPMKRNSVSKTNQTRSTSQYEHKPSHQKKHCLPIKTNTGHPPQQTLPSHPNKHSPPMNRNTAYQPKRLCQ